jgi:hypothetical protein
VTAADAQANGPAAGTSSSVPEPNHLSRGELSHELITGVGAAVMVGKVCGDTVAAMMDGAFAAACGDVLAGGRDNEAVEEGDLGAAASLLWGEVDVSRDGVVSAPTGSGADSAGAIVTARRGPRLFEWKSADGPASRPPLPRGLLAESGGAAPAVGPNAPPARLLSLAAGGSAGCWPASPAVPVEPVVSA